MTNEIDWPEFNRRLRESHERLVAALERFAASMARLGEALQREEH